MINNPEDIQEVLNVIDSITKEDVMSALFEMEQEKQDGIAFVGTRGYFYWLIYEFLPKLEENTYHSEIFLYMKKDAFSTDDINNESKICWIPYFLEYVRKKQRAPRYIDDNTFDDETDFLFKFGNKIYMYIELIGQGSVTIIREASKNDCIFRPINLDKYFSESEGKNGEI